jgi:hypothetical protein
MAKSFSNPTFYNSGKPSFGNTFESNYASDYLRNKKAKLLYANNFNGYRETGRLGSQNNYLLYGRAKLIRNVETCATIPAFNKDNMVSGLYTTENLGSRLGAGGYVNVVADASYNSDASCPAFSATTIKKNTIYPDTSTKPFYQVYKIDPCGLLFGNTPCGYDNYEIFRVYSKPAVNTKASLTGCNPVCINKVCTTVCDKQP